MLQEGLPSFFETEFFNKSFPQLGLYKGPVDMRSAVVKKEKKEPGAKIIFAGPTTGEDLVQIVRLTTFVVNVGPSMYTLEEQALIGSRDTLTVKFLNQMPVAVELRVYFCFSTAMPPVLVYAANVAEQFTGLVNGQGKKEKESTSGNHYFLKLRIFRNQSGSVRLEKIHLKQK